MGELYEYTYLVNEEPEITGNGIFFKHGRAKILDCFFSFKSPFYKCTTILTFPVNDVNAKFWHDSCIANVRKNMLIAIAATKIKSNGALLIHTKTVTTSIK